MAGEISNKLGRVLEIDFVNQFGNGVLNLLEILGVTNQTELAQGSVIKTYKSEVTLDGEEIKPGDVIPLSKVDVTVDKTYELEWDKKRKAVSAEDIQKFGLNQALLKTDEKLLRKLQANIKKSFFEKLKEGTTTTKGAGLQGAAAEAWGALSVKYEEEDAMNVGFINPMDLAGYLADANITTQEAFGLKYIQNFLNFDVVIVSNYVEKGKVYATASGNINLAYASIGSGDISQIFEFTTDELGLIGITHNAAKDSLTAETIMASALVIYPERTDGVIVSTIEDKATKAGASK